MPEELPIAMVRAGIDRRNIPHPRTIWRAEANESVPRLCYRFGLAQFFGVSMASLWPAEERSCRRG